LFIQPLEFLFLSLNSSPYCNRWRINPDPDHTRKMKKPSIPKEEKAGFSNHGKKLSVRRFPKRKLLHDSHSRCSCLWKFCRCDGEFQPEGFCPWKDNRRSQQVWTGSCKDTKRAAGSVLSSNGYPTAVIESNNCSVLDTPSVYFSLHFPTFSGSWMSRLRKEKR